MSARVLRGLGRKLKSYHVASVGAPEGIAEAADLAKVELQWLHASASASKAKSRCSHSDRRKTERDISRCLVDLVRRRTRQDEPIAYLLGNQPFGSLDIAVRPPVLIPRPETEQWTLDLAGRINEAFSSSSVSKGVKSLNILDLCSGSGCIGLTLARMITKVPVSVTCVDISPESVELIHENIRRNNLEKLKSPVRVLQADLFNDVDIARLGSRISHGHTRVTGQYDLVVCNPPYIPPVEYLNLDRSVRCWENRAALVGERQPVSKIPESQDGLVFYRRLAGLIPKLLSRNSIGQLPRVVVEVGAGQAKAVEEILLWKKTTTTVSREKEGELRTAEFWKDHWGIERVVAGY